MDKILPNGWLWNQAELDPGSNLNGVLVSLVAFMPNRSPRVVGTGFALNVEDEEVATFCTAAHVVEFAAELQQKQTRHHATALPEFLPPRAPLQLAPEVLRALYFDGTHVEMAVVEWIVWDAKDDVSFFGVRAQAPGTARRFHNDIRLTASKPGIGTRVAILGLDGMEVVDEDRVGTGMERFAIARRLVLRAGVISGLHPDGHALCRGPCFETTIPVSPGMSGSPVVLLTEPGEPMTVVGVVSHSPSSEHGPLDRQRSGESIVARIAPDITYRLDGKQVAQFRLESPRAVIPPGALKAAESE